MERWSAGEAVVLRSVLEGAVRTAMPVTVVFDDGDERGVCVRPGTAYRRRSGERGGPRGRQLVRWDGTHEDATWHTNRALHLSREGDPCSISAFWDDASGAFLGWYVNLEHPWRRTRLGFDTFDLDLDIVVMPGLAEWRWKDEDEFAWGLEHGRYGPIDPDALRAAGLAAVERLRRERDRFERWLAWRPDPSWPLPTLPPGWDVPL